MLNRITRALQRCESVVLVSLFVTLLLVAVVQVLLRNVSGFSLGLSWGDELVRMAVLWITMVGAMMAVRQGGHIRIDLLDRFLSGKWSKVARIVANTAASVICFLFAYHAVILVWWEFQDKTYGIGVIPFWVLVAIIPISGFVMSIRFALALFVEPTEE